MRAVFRLGAVALPCVEQVTDAEVAERVATTGARLVLLTADDIPLAAGPAPAPDLDPDAPGFLIFTSGTEGRPKAAVHPRRYLEANRLQLERWMGVRRHDRVWCTAAPGWSKSVRNVVVPGRAVRLRDGAARRPLHRRRAARAARPPAAAGALHVADRVPPLRQGPHVRRPRPRRHPRGRRRRRGARRRDARPVARGVRHHRARRLRADRVRRRHRRAGRRGAGAGIDGPRHAGRASSRSSAASCACAPRRCRRSSPATWTMPRPPPRSSRRPVAHRRHGRPRRRRPALVPGPCRRRHLVVRLSHRAGRGGVRPGLARRGAGGGGGRAPRSRPRRDRPRRRRAPTRPDRLGRATARTAGARRAR